MAAGASGHGERARGFLLPGWEQERNGDRVSTASSPALREAGFLLALIRDEFGSARSNVPRGRESHSPVKTSYHEPTSRQSKSAKQRRAQHNLAEHTPASRSFFEQQAAEGSEEIPPRVLRSSGDSQGTLSSAMDPLRLSPAHARKTVWSHYRVSLYSQS